MLGALFLPLPTATTMQLSIPGNIRDVQQRVHEITSKKTPV
jgi:hypothetical protein